MGMWKMESGDGAERRGEEVEEKWRDGVERRG